MILLLALSVLHAGNAQPALPGDFVRALTFIPCCDADGDGIRDLAIGLPRDDAHGIDAGRVFILSGKDGSVIRELHAGGPFSGFGFALAAGADFDGDGKPDIAVAAHRDGFPPAPPWTASDHPARIYIFTLATGELTRTLEPRDWSFGEHWASELHLIGDVDEDGAADLLVESRNEADVLGGYQSPMALMSCKKGAPLSWVEFDRESRPFFVGNVCSCQAACIAVPGKDGFTLLHLSSLEPVDMVPRSFGDFRVRSLLDLGDMDGDAKSETAVLGTRDERAHCEDVEVVSFETRVTKRVFEVRGDDLRREAGIEASASGRTLDVCAAPDIDGDGCRELFVMLPGASRSLTRAEWELLHPGTVFLSGTELDGFGVLISSRTRRILWKTFGTSREPLGMTVFERGFGEEVHPVMDVDHDGLDDLGVSAAYASTSEPYESVGASVQVLSSRDGAPLMRIEARPGAEPRVVLSDRVRRAQSPK